MTKREWPTSEATRRRQRAEGLVALGLVYKVGGRFLVEEPSFARERPRYFAWRDEQGRVRCTCAEFASRARHEPKYRCVHILAAARAVATERFKNGPQEPQSAAAKVLSFDAHRTLRKHVVAAEQGQRRTSPSLSKIAPTIPWHAVVAALDSVSPTWEHNVEEIKPFGTALVVVTASITVGGVTRSGRGRGSSRTDLGFQQAEQQALKHAAVQFPAVAAALIGSGPVPPGAGGLPRKPRGNPEAKTKRTRVTPGQQQTLKNLSERLGLDPHRLSHLFYRCPPDNLNKRFASALITYLLSLLRMRERGEAPLRLAS